MKKLILISCIIFFYAGARINAQNVRADSVWTLDSCINYALSKNIDVRKSELYNQQNFYNAEQAKAQRFPSLNASISQNFDWSKSNSTTTSGFSGVNGSNYSVNSGITVFNASKLSNQIKQSELTIESGNYSLAATKEAISLSILNAYLQVLYAEEQVNNSKKQIESTQSQLDLAQQRLLLQVISQADYAQVKAQLASEKLTLANSENNLAIAKVNLEQLMELPVSAGFKIAHPDLEGLVNKNLKPDVNQVFATALSIKPEIKNAAVNKEIAALGEKIAKAGYYPVLSASAGVSSGFSSRLTGQYFDQLNNGLQPAAGLSLAIPIYQRKQVKTNVIMSKINYQNSELDEINTKNTLRKSIEQACQNVSSAQVQYEASLENYNATSESEALSEEKFKQGVINSVDYLVSKTNLIVAESELLQSKFNLIFSYKVLDFYTGVPLTL